VPIRTPTPIESPSADGPVGAGLGSGLGDGNELLGSDGPSLDRAPRVLIVEDNEPLAENVAELFQELGAEASICMDADAALDRAARWTFDLAVVDVRLPRGVRGVDLVPELRALSPDGEVIVVTGNATLDTAIAAVREGVFAYVQKPFDPDDLLALGERALTQVQLRHERAALARELARSEALYRGVVETVDALIVALDRDGRIAFANRAAAERIGRRAASLVGVPFPEAFARGPDRNRLRKAYQDARAGRLAPNLELRVPREGPSNGGEPGDSDAVVIWTLTPLRSETKGPPLVLAAGADVTARRDLERRAAENEAMAAMGELTTGLAHEIRNPLNAAKLQLELLGRRARRLDPVGGQLDGPVRIVKDELGRLSRLAEEFLSLARPRPLARTAVDLRELLDEVVEMHAPLARAEQVTVTVEAEPDLPPADADPERIKQVLLNLVSNAIESMRGHPERRLALAARRPGDGDGGAGWVEVEVRDTGPGLPGEAVADLFRPFVTTKEAGTGLGLPIVQRIVEQHGGLVLVGPGPEGGTSACFRLPSWRNDDG